MTKDDASELLKSNQNKLLIVDKGSGQEHFVEFEDLKPAVENTADSLQVNSNAIKPKNIETEKNAAFPT